ncbi:MAG: exodeoxyribonuclease VII large subunit [Nitrospinae bacterium]|nr:exodeoxyribonuclease VII large subunit [Nitrospinota bacterium]
MPEPEEGGRKVYTVAELTAGLKHVIESEFSGLWVEGEISNFKVYPSGHAYFTLKDEEAQIRSVMWKGMRQLLKFEPKDGDKVICRGRLSVYEKRGEYQLTVEAMEPAGLGALQMAFNRLKEKLTAEGLFGEKRKKALPYIAWSVGIITSPAGAVLRDMVRTIKRRFPGLRIVFAPVAVQGDGAKEQIAKAIADMNEYGKVDVIICGRGGGSLEDLWAFNEEIVARAIAGSKIPVVSAVGHETDFTIADFAADARASTPTAAAEIIAPERADVESTIEEFHRRLFVEMRDIVETRSQRLDDAANRLERGALLKTGRMRDKLSAAARHLMAVSPAAQLKNRRERLANAHQRLTGGLTRARDVSSARAAAALSRINAIRPENFVSSRRDALNRAFEKLGERLTASSSIKRKRLEVIAGKLDALSPLKALARGYSIVTSPDGKKIYTRAADLRPGDHVRIKMSDGETQATIRSAGGGKQEKLF